MSKLLPSLRSQPDSDTKNAALYQTSYVQSLLTTQEFLPENPEEESPFGSLDASELEEVFEDSGVPRVEIDALKVALR